MTDGGKKSLLSVLGLARRAGKLAMGRTQAKQALHSKDAAVILLASDISEALAREISHLASLANDPPPIIRADITIDEIHFACSFKAGVIAVTDKNFAAKIISLSQA